MKKLKTYEEFKFQDIKKSIIDLVKKIGNIFHIIGWKIY